MMVGRHADCCPIKATTCTHMHARRSAMLARPGRQGGGLFGRTVSEISSETVMSKRDLRQPHTGGLQRRQRGSRVHEHEHCLHALVGT